MSADMVLVAKPTNAKQTLMKEWYFDGWLLSEWYDEGTGTTYERWRKAVGNEERWYEAVGL